MSRFHLYLIRTASITTGNTTLPYFPLNFKEKRYIHGKEAITEISVQQIIHSVSSAFMLMNEVVRKIKDDHIHTYSIKQLKDTQPQ